MIRILYCICIWYICSTTSAAEGLAHEEIRVRLPYDTASTVIGSVNGGKISDTQHAITLAPMTKYRLHYNPEGNYTLSIIKNNKPYAISSFVLPITLSSISTTANNQSSNDLFFLDRYWYHGDIVIKKSNIGTIAINYIPIDQLLTSYISNLTTAETSREAAKAGIVLYRTSLKCLLMNQQRNNQIKNDYDIYGTLIDYWGYKTEREDIRTLVERTRGEILLSASGQLECTPLKSALTEGSLPFEMIGYKTNAWEKVLAFNEISVLMRQAGYDVDDIVSVQRLVAQGVTDNEPLSISVITPDSTISLTPSKTKEIFGLPSEFFRIYSYQDDNGTTRIQFIGNMAGYNKDTKETGPILNLIAFLEDSRSYEGQDYESILKEIYPTLYLVKY